MDVLKVIGLNTVFVLVRGDDRLFTRPVWDSLSVICVWGTEELADAYKDYQSADTSTVRELDIIKFIQQAREQGTPRMVFDPTD